MDARAELAERLLLGKESVEVILSDYFVTRIGDGGDVSKQIKHFLDAKRVDGLSEKTLINYKYILDIFASRIIKDIMTITTNDVREHITYLVKERHLKSSTLQSQLAILRSFFSWLYAEEIIGKNPMIRIKSTKINKKNTRQALSIEQLELLREACNTTRERALIEFLYSTGCRVSEIVNIKLDKIDWKEQAVVIVGKGDRERTVYFTAKAKILMNEYIRQRKGGDVLFVSDKRPYASLQTRGIQAVISKIGDRVGIHSFPHILRHSFATHHLKRKMDLVVIQKLLGHEHYSSTQVYAQLDETVAKQQFDSCVA